MRLGPRDAHELGSPRRAQIGGTESALKLRSRERAEPSPGEPFLSSGSPFPRCCGLCLPAFRMDTTLSARLVRKSNILTSAHIRASARKRVCACGSSRAYFFPAHMHALRIAEGGPSHAHYFPSGRCASASTVFTAVKGVTLIRVRERKGTPAFWLRARGPKMLCPRT